MKIAAFSQSTWETIPEPVRATLRMVLVRLRLLIALVSVLAIVGYWPALRDWWDHVTGASHADSGAVSLDIEYWCPMCPGVISAWPSKCPVCHMTLVRRTKGDATPLPDGVVARMQLSPYRVQLAGIKTAVVGYRQLAYEIAVVGFVEATSRFGAGRCSITGEIFEKDLSAIAVGVIAAARSDAAPGQSFSGKVVELAPQLAPDTRTLKSRLEFDDPRNLLRPGVLLTAVIRAPVAKTQWYERSWIEIQRDRLIAGNLGQAVDSAPGAERGPRLDALISTAGALALRSLERVPAIPESAVVDTGGRKVVYVERMPGTFDAIEVELGRRCGEYYPVLRGLELGDRVVSAGTLLLDAESRLNPSIAASYFGAERHTGASTKPPDEGSNEAATRVTQKLCPVTDEPLGSMGAPLRVVIDGKPIYLCCKACEPELRRNPAKYLAKLAGD